MLIHLVLYQKIFEKAEWRTVYVATPIHVKVRELYFFQYAQVITRTQTFLTVMRK